MLRLCLCMCYMFFYMLLSAEPTLLCISVCSLEMVKEGKVNVVLDNAGIEEGYLFFY